MDAESSSSLTTRPTLLFRLRAWDDGESWTEFYRLYHKLVHGMAKRSGLSHEEAEEVTQDVFKRVAETIEDFECDPQHGSFRGWLMNLTRWKITDKFRERRRNHGHATTTSSTEGAIPPIEEIPCAAVNDDEDKEWQQHVLNAAIARIRRRVPAKQFQAFELLTQQHWSVLKIASELKMNPGQVYLVRHRVAKELKLEVDRLKAILF